MTGWRSSVRPVLRHAALSIGGCGYRGSGRFDRLMSRPRVQVLLLHHVPAESLAAFERGLKELSRHVSFVTYSQAVSMVTQGRIDQPCITFTFDDGFKSCLDAARAMNQFGASACFFINPPYIGAQTKAQIRNLPSPYAHGPGFRPYMDWHDLEHLIAQGHEIGSHTMTHRRVSDLLPEQVRQELFVSRDELTRKLGSVRHFAWPFGRFSDFTAEAAHEVFSAGYLSCASGVRGSHGPGGQAAFPPCIRRDHWMTTWPASHLRFFLARSAQRPLSPEATWPADWRAMLSCINTQSAV